MWWVTVMWRDFDVTVNVTGWQGAGAAIYTKLSPPPYPGVVLKRAAPGNYVWVGQDEDKKRCRKKSFSLSKEWLSKSTLPHTVLYIRAVCGVWEVTKQKVVRNGVRKQLFLGGVHCKQLCYKRHYLTKLNVLLMTSFFSLVAWSLIVINEYAHS